MKQPKSNTEIRHSADGQKKESRRKTYYGDVLKRKKKKGKLRILFQNINGLGTSEENDKREIIRDFINDYKIDIFAIAEMNINWKIVAKKESLHTYFKDNFKNSRVSVCHNVWGNTKHPHQQGGVGIATTGDIALRVTRSEPDHRKLGRWTSTVIQGKHNMVTRIASVYVPHVAKGTSSGMENVYAQQQAALLKMKHTQSVITTFWSDFWKEVDGWLSKGEQLILCGDWNTDVYDARFREEFEKRNLLPATTGRHRGQAPPTYNKGSTPIDEIFVSRGLEISGSGYLDHGTNEGDHCPLWVDISTESALGINPPKVNSIHARRLTMKDTNTVNKYNTVLQEEFDKKKVYTRALDLYNQYSGKLTPTQMAEYDDLDYVRSQAMKKAERKCRKLHMGALPWSPTLQHSRNRIQYIKLTIRRKKGRRVSARYLMRLSRKVGQNLQYNSITVLSQSLHICLSYA